MKANHNDRGAPSWIRRALLAAAVLLGSGALAFWAVLSLLSRIDPWQPQPPPVIHPAVRPARGPGQPGTGATDTPAPADGGTVSVGQRVPGPGGISATPTQREPPAMPGTPPGGGVTGVPPGVVPPGTGDGADTGGPLSRPPDMDEREPPTTLSAQIGGLVEEARHTSGPEAAVLGRRLLDATNPVLRVAGLAILDDQHAADEAAVERVADDEDLAVPVNAVGWLLDAGRTNLAAQLSARVDARLAVPGVLTGLLNGDTLISAGERAVLQTLGGDLAPAAFNEVAAAVAEDASRDYSVRMKALLLRRSTMDFVDFRNEVDRLRAGAAGAEEALWKEGLDRLADRLAGPVPVQAGPPAVTPEDIDEMLAREYPMSMEDLAQHLEYAVEQPDAFIQQGTAARLAERVEALDRQPWTEDQQVSLQRLRNVRPALAARERPAAENPSGETPPPDAAN